MGRLTWISSAPARNGSVRAVALILNPSWAHRRAGITNGSVGAAHLNSAPAPAHLNSGYLHQQSSTSLFSEMSPPSRLVSPPSSLVLGWLHGRKTALFLVFCWAGQQNQLAAQSHKHKQVLPLLVAAASCQSSSAVCWNHTSSFLICLSIFNQSFPPPSLPCRQLQKAAGDNRVLHQANFPGKKSSTGRRQVQKGQQRRSQTLPWTHSSR